MELEFERKDRVSRTRAASSPAPMPSSGPSGSRAGLILRVDDGPIEHFRDQVIGGRGACVLAASEFDGFARAVVEKLLQDLNVSVLPQRRSSG